jgi:hypothetical protein
LSNPEAGSVPNRLGGRPIPDLDQFIMLDENKEKMVA